MKKRLLSVLLALVMMMALIHAALAKTIPAGQTVGNVLFYVSNAKGEEILVSMIPVSEMEADMKAGRVDATNHNYSLLDKFVTTVHQEAQGLSIPDFIDYAQSKSPLGSLKSLPLSFTGKSTVSTWEIDQTGFDDMDTYTYSDLYGVKRYNFPLLYEYWNYEKQDYYDPAGVLTRAQVIDHIFENAQPESAILSVRAFSQRYMVTEEKFGVDYNMENYWYDTGVMDNQRTPRFMIPMTRDELYNKTPTASNSRYWSSNIRLTMENAPEIASLGKVAAPTATVTESGDNYYVRFYTATEGASILYNHNFISPSYTPTSPYGDSAVVIPKENFPSGTITMTARAVKEGCVDEGVVTLKLTASGKEANPESANTYADVPETNWAYKAVDYVVGKNLFDMQDKNTFGASVPMTRAMLAVALYRLEGSPSVSHFADFADVTKGTPLSAAVSWAFDAGVVSGDGKGNFNPGRNITREQITTMLYNYAVYKKQNTALRGDLADFKDGAKTAGWARGALSWAYACKIVTGDDRGNINPQGTATKAQAAQLLYNYIRDLQ